MKKKKPSVDDLLQKGFNLNKKNKKACILLIISYVSPEKRPNGAYRNPAKACIHMSNKRKRWKMIKNIKMKKTQTGKTEKSRKKTNNPGKKKEKHKPNS